MEKKRILNIHLCYAAPTLIATETRRTEYTVGTGASIVGEVITAYFAANQLLYAIKVSIGAFYVSDSQILFFEIQLG